MTLSLHDFATETFVPMLGTLTHLLDKAAAHAAAKNVDVATLVDARLAPDMLPFSSQVRLACQHAEVAVAHLTGQEPPPMERVHQTFEQLVTRVRATLEALQQVPRAAFDGAEQRPIAIVIDTELAFDMTGLQFLRDWLLPNFYFHVTTAYDILRHHGVELGKRDYLRGVGRYRRSPAPAQ
jgi:uncharacterized protein